MVPASWGGKKFLVPKQRDQVQHRKGLRGPSRARVGTRPSGPEPRDEQTKAMRNTWLLEARSKKQYMDQSSQHTVQLLDATHRVRRSMPSLRRHRNPADWSAWGRVRAMPTISPAGAPTRQRRPARYVSATMLLQGSLDRHILEGEGGRSTEHRQKNTDTWDPACSSHSLENILDLWSRTREDCDCLPGIQRLTCC